MSKFILTAAAFFALAAWTGVQHVQLGQARDDAAAAYQEALLAYNKASETKRAVTALDHRESADSEQVREDNVQDRDATEAIIYCVRFATLTATCLDAWYEEFAQGDF